ncbi:MAG: hypothetical protein U0X40_04975 [Ferruginibacter sp.]
MNSQYSLPIVHPSFELLKRSGRFLHFVAASLILMNAFRGLRTPGSNSMLCYLELIIAADIYLLVFLGAELLAEAPRFNLFFRLIEMLSLSGIGILLLHNGETTYGILHLLLALGFYILFHRERRVMRSEVLNIRATGISMPNFIRDAEMGWYEIKSIRPDYHSILIETFRNTRIRFNFRRNLKIEELQQIDDFCRKQMGEG